MNEVNYDSKFFIFNKSFSKDQLVKIFEENVDKIQTTHLSNSNANYMPSMMNLINLDSLFTSSFYEGIKDSKFEEKSGLTSEALKALSENFVETFDSVKILFKSLKINMRVCEKIRDNYNYQYNSLECIYKNISLLYEQCYNKYKEIDVDVSKMNDRNEKILNNFKESIERLKTIELHPKMQTPKAKCLIDIYFDEAKMNVWKDKCQKSSEFINKKIKTKGDIVSSEKNKIRNEKNTNILQLKNDWNNIIGEYENFISEKETFALSTLTSICEDVKMFQKKLIIFHDLAEKNDMSNPNVDETIEGLKMLKSKSATHQEEIQNFQQNLNTIEEFAKKMKNILYKSSSKINTVFTNYHMIKKTLLEIMEKLEKYSFGLVTLEKDFSYLSNPASFPQAYNASILEIKRRIVFNKKLTKDFDRLKALLHKENLNRKQFIQDYGKYLTHDYIPQLKFTELKLTIDYYNNDEVTNIPYLLDEAEESTINNHNTYLEYDEVSIVSNSDNVLLALNPRNSRDNILGIGLGINCNNVNVSSSNNISTRKNSEDREVKKLSESEDTIRLLNAKLCELEIMNNIKEGENKKLLNKLEQKERKANSIQSEFDRLASTIDNISENFLKQISYKDQKMKEKIAENENLIKMINLNSGNKLENCLMCRDAALNSIDYQSWGNFVKDYHDKIIDKNKTLSKIEARYGELVAQTSFIKKTFFNHIHSVIENKNYELMNVKSTYENKLMNVEDLLSSERMKIEKYLYKATQENLSLEEDLKNKKSEIFQFENKIRDLNRLLSNSDSENKKSKNEKEQLKKIIEELKVKENSYIIELKMRESKCEVSISDYNSLEKQYDNQKKNINQLSEEIITKAKENSNLKHSQEINEKLIVDLEKSLENSKINHIETLNEIHKANQLTIEKLNVKIDEVTITANEKFRSIEDLKSKYKEMESTAEANFEEIKISKEKYKELEGEFEKIEILLDESLKDSEVQKEMNEKLHKKLEDLQGICNEKEKKIIELNELTKFFSSAEIPNISYNKTGVNTNNEMTTDTMVFGNFNMNNLTKLFEEEFINIKKLELGIRSIFVPHSPGIYVSISLNCNQFDPNLIHELNNEVNKYYRCNAILNLESLDAELKELLLENSLIVIGKISKLTEHIPNTENNPYELPEDNHYILVDLDKIDFVIGFHGEDMIFRNYLF